MMIFGIVIIVFLILLLVLSIFLLKGKAGKDLLRRLVEIAFESATTEDFVHRVKFEYINGYFGEDLNQIKKELITLAKKKTNIINHAVVKQVLEGEKK